MCILLQILLHKFQKNEKNIRANNRTSLSRVRSLRTAMLRKPCFGSWSCLKLFFEICYAQDEGSISADKSCYLGICCLRKNLVQVVLNLLS